MISKTEIAVRYYKLKTGENLDRELARKRWAMTKNPDEKILKKVLDGILKEQKKKMGL